MMVVEDAQIIDALKPNFQALSALPGRGVAITAPVMANTILSLATSRHGWG
jgi:hypothetical protein